jgi:protein TonB
MADEGKDTVAQSQGAAGKPEPEASAGDFLARVKSVERPAAPPKVPGEETFTDLPPGKPIRKDATAEIAEPPPLPTGTEPAEQTLFGVLNAEQRIRRSAEQNERTLWTGAVLATLIYAFAIAGPSIPGIAVLFPPPADQAEKERRGQDSIDVEIVPDPDRNTQTKRWREGALPSPQPADQLPQPAQTAALQPPDKPDEKTEEQQTQEQTEPRPDSSPMALDIDSLVDAAAADLTKKIDQAFAKKPKKQHEAQVISGGDLQVRGKGAAGKSNPYTRSVIAALLKTRPGPFALWGRVLVSFQIGDSGQINYVHMLQSSGNSAMDEAAVEAIRKAHFGPPPPGLSPDDRTYIIDYIFG